MLIQIPDKGPPAINLLPEDDRTADGNELSRQRELKTLRARVVKLEADLQDTKAHLVGSAIPEAFDEVHNIATCGFHTRVLVSMKTSSVSCASCGTELSALDVLREYASSERNFVHHSNHLQVERKEMEQEVAALKKQRASLKAQVRDYERRTGIARKDGT